jgi:hypothetical protein
MDTSQHLAAQRSERESDTDGGVVSLPHAPRAAEATALRSGGGSRRLDRFLIVLVLVLAFLSASFPAHNSDLWFHLATGRRLAQRQFTFGSDPFAYTSGQTYWAAHSWLSDLVLYELYELVGATGLVILKALLVPALAGLLLRVRRPTRGAGLLVLCTTLAVLAMSPRLRLQPTCVSYFLLAWTFWLLFSAQNGQPSATGPDRPPETAGGERRTGRRWLILLFVFVVWVNVDEWFLLGPALAALFWLGERLGGGRRMPGWVIPAGLAVCLLNPHTFHAFTLPTELSVVPWTSGLREDPRFQALFASPWQPAYLRTAAELNAAALAYFALTFLGLASFLLHRPALRDGRLIVFLPFALLAAWQSRAIPFFAVVAAPVTALNGQDFLAGRRRERSSLSGPGFASSAGRMMMAAALLALIFLTWPGWLAGYGREARHVGWGIEANPSLRRVAQTLDRWRLSEGERVFALSPEVSQYACWFADNVKAFFDHRYPLFSEAARDYETVCQALEPGLVPGKLPEQGSAKDWQKVLHDRGVSIVVLYDRDPRRLLLALRRLGSDSEHWTLLRVEGEAVIFGWNAARPRGGFAQLAFDADRLAFGPQDEEARRQLPAAPAQGPAHLPTRRDLRSRWLHPPAPTAWQSAAATVYLHYFDDSEASQRQQEMFSSLAGYAASLAGLPALPPAVPRAALQIVSSHNVLYPRADASPFLVRDQLGPFFAHLAERPPALPLLTIRAARLAVAENPEDGNAWLRLGEAYMALRLVTWEHSGEGLLPPLAQLRFIQIVTALEQAVRLDPDLDAAHHELAHLYAEHRYFDKALEHLQEEHRLSRKAGARPGETAGQFAYRLELLERDAASLEKVVQEGRRAYAARSRPLQGERSSQASMAVLMGLPRQALEDILLPTPADVLGAAGMKLELELLLRLGRIDEVREILNDDKFRAGKDRLPYHDLPAPRNSDGIALYTLPYHWPTYGWFLALQAAAIGDYAQARETLRAIRAGLYAGHDRVSKQLRALDRGAPTLLPMVLSGPPVYLPVFAAHTIARLGEERKVLQAGTPALLAQQADLCVLEGLLALEEGDLDAARTTFVEAQKLCEHTAEAVVPFAGRPIAVNYLRKLHSKE